MPDADIPFIDETIARQPMDLRNDLAELGRTSLFFFGKGVLGHKDMTQRCHGPVCEFIDSNPKRWKLILQPRDTLKTSTVTVGGAMQKAVRDPNKRILIANEAATNAQRMLWMIRQHAETNKVFRALYGEVIPKDTRKVRWNNEEIDFVRTVQCAEPTFDSIGMTGSSTSRHFTDIIIDDAISMEAIKSEKVMQDTITRLSAFPDLLVDALNNDLWMVGTRWAFHDTYSWFVKTFGTRIAKLVRSIVEDGEPIWPERFPMEAIDLKRASLGEYLFSCTQMNNPRNVDLQDLNIEDLRFWRWTADESGIEVLDENSQVIRTVKLSQLQITTTVDLAPAETASSDRNAVVTVGITPWDEVIVLDAWGKRCTPLEVIEKLISLKQRFNPSKFGIEDVAYQKAFKYFLKTECERRGVYMRVVPLKAVGKKEVRIRGLQPVLATHHIYVGPAQHLLRNEMSEFPLGEYDDVLDAFAMQLQMWKGRMSPERWEKLNAESKRMLNPSGHIYEQELRRQLGIDPDELFDGEFHRFQSPSDIPRILRRA